MLPNLGPSPDLYKYRVFTITMYMLFRESKFYVVGLYMYICYMIDIFSVYNAAPFCCVLCIFYTCTCVLCCFALLFV